MEGRDPGVPVMTLDVLVGTRVLLAAAHLGTILEAQGRADGKEEQLLQRCLKLCVVAARVRVHRGLASRGVARHVW